MRRVFLGFGSNIGESRKNIEHALALLAAKNELCFRQCSHLYRTEPVGKKDQPYFLNMVAECETTLSPHALLKRVKEVEQKVGRVPREQWGPREIDIDILFYENECSKTDNLVLPHPELERRRFVLVPLAELAPDFRDPRSGKLVKELLAECTDTSIVQQVE